MRLRSGEKSAFYTPRTIDWKHAKRAANDRVFYTVNKNTQSDRKTLLDRENPGTEHDKGSEKRRMGEFRTATELSGGRTQAVHTSAADISKVQPKGMAAAAGRRGARTGRMSGQTRHSSTESGDSSILIVRTNSDPYICSKTEKNR